MPKVAQRNFKWCSAVVPQGTQWKAVIQLNPELLYGLLSDPEWMFFSNSTNFCFPFHAGLNHIQYSPQFIRFWYKLASILLAFQQTSTYSNAKDFCENYWPFPHWILWFCICSICNALTNKIYNIPARVNSWVCYVIIITSSPNFRQNPRGLLHSPCTAMT